jgi:hypothetical protein
LIADGRVGLHAEDEEALLPELSCNNF